MLCWCDWTSAVVVSVGEMDVLLLCACFRTHFGHVFWTRLFVFGVVVVGLGGAYCFFLGYSRHTSAGEKVAPHGQMQWCSILGRRTHTWQMGRKRELNNWS